MFLDGYIDTHNHILPGLDDGPVGVDEAVDMARVAYAAGITKIVATPHHNDFHQPTKQEILESLELLRLGLAEANVPVEVYPGNELRIDPRLPAELKDGSVLPLADSRFILLEFPFDGIPFFAENVIFQLRLDGWRPILAHCERIYDIQQKPQRLQKYIDMGCMVQVNSNSLTGELGRKSRDVAIRLLKLGFVDVLASDAHAAHRRVPDFAEALAEAEKVIGHEAAEKLVRDNPAKIFDRTGDIITEQ